MILNLWLIFCTLCDVFNIFTFVVSTCGGSTRRHYCISGNVSTATSVTTYWFQGMSLIGVVLFSSMMLTVMILHAFSNSFWIPFRFQILKQCVTVCSVFNRHMHTVSLYWVSSYWRYADHDNILISPKPTSATIPIKTRTRVNGARM